MIDKSRPARKARPPLPAFTPVPRHTNRHDGWTPERQRGFIEALADTGSVRRAAHAVNMTPEGAYVLRRHPEAASFRKAWEAALALGVQRLEDVMMERALHGVEVPVYAYGKIIGTRTVYNDRLLMFVLRNRASKRFGGGRASGALPGNGGAATRSHHDRLARELRAQWDAERRAESVAASRDLEPMFARLHQEWVHNMSAETLRYYKAFRLATCAQERKTSLAEQGIDPFDPQFDMDGTLKAIDAAPPTTIRGRAQEMAAGHDSAEAYLTPRVRWEDMPDEDEEEEED